ncbi:MAG: DNA methyltransferase [Spirochaetales bacterium]|jgi:DNA modification methylase|nr:DNA methyltransferase [Spirochaetales bacterium]
MQIETKTVKVSDIKLNPDNPRQISMKDMELLTKSLQDFPDMLNIREIVVDETMTCIGGNMRLQSLRKLKAKECTAKIVTGLTEAQRREFIIKDNGSWGEFNMDLLSGWDDLPLVDWGVPLPEDWLKLPDETADAEPQIDKAAELNKVWQVKTGDLWQVGDHRLLNGDSTKVDNVAKVIGNDKPQLMVTDPPYGIALDATWRDGVAKRMGKAQKGKLNQDDGFEWMPALGLATTDVAYVYHHHNFGSIIQTYLENAGYQIKQQIIWVKTVHTLTMSHYQQKHEPCWYAILKGKNTHWIGGRDQMSAFELASPKQIMSGSDEEKQAHPTQKPLEAFAILIRNHDSEFVYDPFLGYGTTMVACQNLNRKCRGIEISEAYCAVILQRMFDAFKIKGVLIS